MIETAEQEGFAPPAHLIARLHRNRANARRKSSAASSRRNSLSSAHSHTSSRSHRRASTPGCQSNYVAQHLRRASILQSRKDRLADRALHAEQVRLRAALAKASPKVTSATIEEKALAAQLAKEKYLAKVAAACAEEVARAKRIAEEVKERKLAEETRLRLEMEERHAEAEKRRQEYQRNLQARRARRADSAEKKLAVVEEIIDDADEQAVATAATRIQRAWRLAQRRAIVNRFVKLNISMDRASKTSFEDMTQLIAEDDVISATTALLIHFRLQAPNDEHAALNTRTFLSAFMMTAHPVSVLQNTKGAQEQDLLSKASELLTSFENNMARLAPWNSYIPSPTQLEALSQSYSTYTSAFAAWRLQDSSVLIEGMVASFVELDAIWQTVRDDSRGEVANDYSKAIRDNQVMLLARIKKLAGAERANILIKKAIRESRRRKPKRRNPAEVRPRGVGSPSPAHDPSQSSMAAPEGTSAVLPPSDELEYPFGEQSSTDITRQLFTPMPNNRVLAHELAIDKEYRLSDTSAELRADLYRSICAAMKQGYESGDGELWTISAAENIREKLLRMLKAGNSLHTLISDALDLNNISRQCRAGIFSYETFFEFMASVLPKLCAPFRDNDIAVVAQELRAQARPDESQVDMMINKLFKLLRTVDMLSLDYTNFMLMNAAPTLIREAPGYESRAFTADLHAGRITLERTKRWFHSAETSLNIEADRRDPEGIRLDRPKIEKVYAKGLVDLAVEQGSLAAEEVPETLELDTERLRDLRRRSIRIVVIGAVLLTAKNLLKRDVRTQWKNEASRLWQLLSNESYENESAEITTAQKAFSILETAHNMPSQTKKQLSATITRLFGQAASRLTDPVLKILLQRLRTHVLGRLSASTSSERVRVASSASEALTSIGLGEMVMHVASIVETLDRVRMVDWQSHSPWYEQIMRSDSRN
ncbi:hypothetical protein M433DRAFT_57453 [Acidomyces richmondensis BFW]|nr:MAG: hypothetical protein FE78DRAFT_140966 [Acidomyces sp. 'richmondensis']KYG50295.1 hypothetical protein M433DRAFT_57453 [Acidomyces richmondensis BFW]